MSKQTKQNDPNVNFGMYEKDREAKREAQTATGAGTLPRGTVVYVRNNTVDGRQIIEGRATIESVINGRENAYNVHFDEDEDGQTYPRFVLPEHTKKLCS